MKYVINGFIIILLVFCLYILYNEKKDTVLLKAEIKGEVNNPGVYNLKIGDRIIDLINYSGGLTNKAVTSYINLSEKISDGDVIVINSFENLDKIVYISNTCTCPDIKVLGCFNVPDNEIIINKISLNIGTKEELMSLSGIGSSKADAIIEYRNSHNGFTSIEELMQVKGIGKSLYEKNKNNITI